MFATIFVSAIVHEYLLALALKFASPVLILEFAGLGGGYYLNFVLIESFFFSHILPHEAVGKAASFKLFCFVCLEFGRSKLGFLLSSRISGSNILPEGSKKH